LYRRVKWFVDVSSLGYERNTLAMPRCRHYTSFFYSKQGWIGEADASNAVGMNQTHSNHVVLIDNIQAKRAWVVDEFDGVIQKNNANRLVGQSTDIPGQIFQHVYSADALISRQPQVALAVKAADCLPILIMGMVKHEGVPTKCPSNRCIAVIHAGRRGTLLSITHKVCRILKSMKMVSIQAWLGPCSCVCCYEIDATTRTHFDLVSENIAQMVSVFTEKGVNVLNAGALECTQCRSDLFYSYRNGDTCHRNVFYLSLNR
jgi:copper oxidase (laccase) domain-containing protein